MTYTQKKTLGLILTAADRLEAHQIAAEIHEHGGSAERWDRADRTPALSAEVLNLVAGERRTTPSVQLEQFYRYGQSDMPRGGKVWKRPVRLSAAATKLLAELRRHDVDYSNVDEHVYVELRDAGLAKVLFSSRGNWVFATSAGRAVAL